MKIYEVELGGGFRHWDESFTYTLARFDNANDAIKCLYEQIREEESGSSEIERIQVREYNVGCEDIEGNPVISYERNLDNDEYEFVLTYERKGE